MVVYTERGTAGLLRALTRRPRASSSWSTTAALFETTKLTPREQICTVGGERGVERKHLDIPISADKRCGPLGQALGHAATPRTPSSPRATSCVPTWSTVASRLGFNDNVPFDAGRSGRASQRALQ